MKKRGTFILFAFFIIAAVALGFVLVNKGDEPVMGIIVSASAIPDTQQYNAREKAPGTGDYIVLAKEFNKLEEKQNTPIPEGRELYLNLYVVECPKGSEFKVSWSKDGKVVKEETKELSTGQKGIIAYKLENELVKTGQYLVEITDENGKLAECRFSVSSGIN